jgi:glycosyltransferase involved in cell wall biosynthesis
MSVLMPTFNGAPFVQATLDSIVAQGDPGIECIVVDDASTDTTLSIIESYRDKLQLVIHRHNTGGHWAKSTNEALLIARGDYVSILHQDDVWLANRISRLRKMAAENMSAGFLFTGAHFIDERGYTLGRWRCPLPSGTGILDRDLLLSRLLVQNFIAIAAPIVRRRVALDVGGLDESVWYTADWDFWLRLASTVDALYDDAPLVGFRLHRHSQTYVRSAAREDFLSQHSTIAQRHLSAPEIGDAERARIKHLSDFSTEVNATLAAHVHGARGSLPRLLVRFLALGPGDGYAYVRDSRILERVAARVRAGLSR